MYEIWTNNTWANWLKDNGVPAETYCIVEVVGWPMSRGKKVLAISKQKTGDDLKALVPKKKKFRILWWANYGGGNVIGSMYLPNE